MLSRPSECTGSMADTARSLPSAGAAQWAMHSSITGCGAAAAGTATTATTATVVAIIRSFAWLFMALPPLLDDVIHARERGCGVHRGGPPIGSRGNPRADHDPRYIKTA